jgi:hypothetical protein
VAGQAAAQIVGLFQSTVVGTVDASPDACFPRFLIGRWAAIETVQIGTTGGEDQDELLNLL